MRSLLYLFVFMTLVSTYAGDKQVASCNQNCKKTMTVSLYYEALCPGCHTMLKTQVIPVWKEMKKQLKLELVPYGWASEKCVKGRYLFTCQHGKEECTGNLLHCCVFHTLCGQKGTKDCAPDKLGTALDYLNCFVRNTEDENCKVQPVSDKCAKKAGMCAKTITAINKCASSLEGEKYLVSYGKQTKCLKPEAEYMPWMLFDYKNNTKDQDASYENFKAVVNKYLQKKCKH